MQILLENGAALRPRDFNNKFPLCHAEENSNENVKKYLQKYRRSISALRCDWFHTESLGREHYNKLILDYAEEMFSRSGYEYKLVKQSFRLIEN